MSSPAAAEPHAAQRALVIGATGYVGRAVIGELCRKRIAAIAHVRFDSPRLEEWRARCSAQGAEVATTAWNAEAFATLIRERKVTLLFLCLGTTFRRGLGRSTSSVPDTYEAVDFGLSRLVIEACVESGAAPRVVLVSAARARAGSRNRYLAARGSVEDALRESGLPFTIARPSYVTGPGRDEFRPLERVGAWFADWALMWTAFLGMQILRERYRSIDAVELARALVSHGLDPVSANKVMLGERLRDFP